MYILKKIKIIYIKNEINLQSRLTIAMDEYPKNPILIINSNTIFPEGWLEMLINDHKNHPNDIISCSIQYYFGKDLTIKEFSEGYKGKYFGIYNHISDMIFNFAIINTDLGGTLYPPGIFKNINFFNDNLFLSISKESDEFWQSCFIIIENRNLRQSSKIYDYTEYLINNEIIIEKKKLFEKIKKKFLYYFPNFHKIVELRQKKIIISFTSYFQRFSFLTNMIESITNQNFLSIKILLFLYENDFNKYNLKLDGVEVIKVKENLKSHKKYYYAMKNYKNYAIITIDDDIYYSSDTILSLYESYINHPNIISGRRTHLIKYKTNRQIDGYFKWVFQQENILNPSYNLFITTGAGAIYPPDILNIEESYINLIKETITTDDITLKYFEINKGIESIWVPNKSMLGIDIKKKIASKTTKNTLFSINKFLNDININKINIDISNKILKKYCFSYKDIKTGLYIYLFNIDNIKYIKENKTFFNIEAYSYCPINNKINFQIFFNKSIAFCSFNNPYSVIKKNSIIYKTKTILKANCEIEGKIKNFEEYYFPVAKSNNTLYMKIYNKKTYLSLIYKYFYCENSFKCIMVALSYKNRKKRYKINININNNNYICRLNHDINYLNNNIPIIAKFSCNKIIYKYYLNESLISGINFIDINKIIKLINNIPNQFLISNIFIENMDNSTKVLIKGKLYESLIKDLNDISISITYPKLHLICNLKNSSKDVLSNIKCYTNMKLNGEILIENQIVYDRYYTEQLLLLNEITLYQNYEIININPSKEKSPYMNLLHKKKNNITFIDQIIYEIKEEEKKKIKNNKKNYKNKIFFKIRIIFYNYKINLCFLFSIFFTLLKFIKKR